MPEMEEKMPESQLESSQITALQGFGFDNVAFVRIIDGLKKNPSQQMQEWFNSQTVHKAWTCAALAAYSGLTEANLKKLKSGESTDPRASTMIILHDKFGIWPYQVFKGFSKSDRDEERVNQAIALVKDYQKQLADFEEQAGRTSGTIDRLQKHNDMLRRYNVWLIAALAVVITAVLVVYIIWEERNPDEGLTGLLRTLFG